MDRFDPNHGNYDSANMKLGETRFPFEAWGAENWRELLDSILKFDNRNPWLPSLDKVKSEGRDPTSRLVRPRVFVSHQQKDAKLAKRIAWLATRQGFTYWLDVLDPDLRSLKGRKLEPRHKALIIAQIVETALMNCTHVVAVLTKAAKNSRWIPYEYGRVKERSIATQLAMTWVDPEYKGYVPEYVILGAEARDEDALRKWFHGQKKWFLNHRGFMRLGRRKAPGWKGPPPEALP